MDVGMELKNTKVKNILTDVELRKARNGVNVEDVEKLLNSICMIYEEQYAVEKDKKPDPSKYVSIAEFNALKAELADSKSVQAAVEEERHAITEILIESRNRAKKVLDQATLESVSIIQKAKDEAEEHRARANEQKDEILQEAENEKNKIAADAAAIVENAELSKNQIIEEANEEKENIIKKAHEEANAIIEMSRLKLHEAEQSKAALIEKANQKAENIVSESRQRKEYNERKFKEIQKNIEEKKQEYSKYISKVEENFGYMHESLIDFKKDLDLMFVSEGND